MMAGAALPERDRAIIVGGGLFAAFAAIGIGMPAGDNAGAVTFVYPPHARLLLLPFGAMAYGAAAAIWSALNLFCVYRAAELMSPRRDLALLACISPAALMMLGSGYAGGFLALMATVVVIQGHTHPGRAGLCLALMTVQPQLALLFGLVLLLVGYGRAVSMAVPWTLALVAAATITCGMQPWVDFLDAAGAPPAAAISLYAGARMVGLPGWAAQALQWGFGFAALAGAALVFSRRGPEPRSIALMLLAVVLALPDAGGDGLVLAAPALTLALFAARPADDRPLLPFAAALLLWIMPAIAVLFAASSWPVAPVLLAAILLAAMAREIAWRPGLAAPGAGACPIEAERERAP